MQKLFSIHIVGRHPWLFSPLRMKLHLERQWFPSLVRSLLAITERSGNVIFRNKAQTLVKRIENQVSVYNQVVGAYSGISRSCPSDPPDPDTSDTLISALELVLKIAARAPCFKPPSNDETSDFPGLHHPSEDFAGDIFYPNNLLPTRSCLSGLSLAQLFDDVLCWSSDSEEMVLDNTKPDSVYQLPHSRV
ncbi:hypothetical protein BGY98DRAFT_641217 [Russula aff. rugulosa BPL654]|nr:hypothetical protein BGY98DRAFT_641217 [Russula aff. rugulosa BPL654]